MPNGLVPLGLSAAGLSGAQVCLHLWIPAWSGANCRDLVGFSGGVVAIQHHGSHQAGSPGVGNRLLASAQRGVRFAPVYPAGRVVPDHDGPGVVLGRGLVLPQDRMGPAQGVLQRFLELQDGLFVAAALLPAQSSPLAAARRASPESWCPVATMVVGWVSSESSASTVGTAQPASISRAHMVMGMSVFTGVMLRSFFPESMPEWFPRRYLDLGVIGCCAPAGVSVPPPVP